MNGYVWQQKCELVKTHLPTHIFHSSKKFRELEQLDYILDYNSTKCAVGPQIKWFHVILVEEKQIVGQSVVFSNALNIPALNAYIIFLETNPNWNQK